MRFFSSLFLVWFFLGSLFLPLVHLVEISHAHGLHGISENTLEQENTPSDAEECKIYVLNFHSERVCFFSQNTIEFFSLPKKEYIETRVSFSFFSDPPPYRGPDPPPESNFYHSLVWIVKSQVYDASSQI